MRVGSTKIAKAFAERRTAKTKNTVSTGEAVLLHNNTIAWWKDGVVHFALAGWNTVTTRDRLNHVFDAFNLPLRVCQIKHEPYVYNYKTQKREEISSRLSYAVSDFI